MQLSKWSGQYVVWNCELEIVDVAWLIDPPVVKFQRVTVALEGLV